MDVLHLEALYRVHKIVPKTKATPCEEIVLHALENTHARIPNVPGNTPQGVIRFYCFNDAIGDTFEVGQVKRIRISPE